MQLYALGLQGGGGCAGAAYGNFSGDAKAHEVVVNHGARLEVLRCDGNGVRSLCVAEAFGVCRSVRTLRPNGATKDYVVVGSDSGQLAVLAYEPAAGRFVRAHCEKFGKTGCRRAVAGQYVAVDPSGRAIMVAAVEKQKLVYMVTRDNAERLVIASPLEAHKQETLTFACEALHVGLDNPMFACLEVNYAATTGAQPPAKSLVLYEVEEGLNHVVRKSVRQTLRSGNMIVPVPGGADGPGGLFVCGDGWIEYQPVVVDPSGTEQTDGFLRAALPRREDVPLDRGVLIVSHVLTHRKLKDRVILFFLLQNEYGDVYRLDIDLSEDRQTLTGFSLKYFDTLPVARSLCLTRRGFLFLAAECGGHKLYKLDAGLGAAGETGRVVAARVKPGLADVAAATATASSVTFSPSPHRNVHFVDALDSLAPCTDMQVEEMFGEDRQQIMLACGRGSRSSVRVLRYGLEVTELAASALPFNPSAVWTVRGAPEPGADPQTAGDKLIVVSFANVTLVLAVGETVEEAVDTGLITKQPTLAVKRCASGGIVQVCADGVHLAKDGETKVIFDASMGNRVDCAALNERQLAIALEGGRIHYFELDEAGAFAEKAVHEAGEDIKCLEIGALPAGRTRSPFLCLGTFSNAVEVLSLQPDRLMKQLSMQALPDQPASICLVDLEGAGLTLAIGLRSGVLVRSLVDEATGTVLDSRTTVLGNMPVRCFPVNLPVDAGLDKRQTGMLALSSRPALAFAYHGQPKFVPLSYRQISHASNFESDLCDGFVAVAGDSLRILSIDDLTRDFNASTIPLRYTPRALLRYRNNLVTLEGDHNVLPQETDGQESPADAAMQDEEDEDDGEEELRAAKMVTVQQTGLPKAGKGNNGRWASLVRVVNPATAASTVVPLDADELALCAAVIGDVLVVGTVVGLELHPQRHREARLRTFKFVPSGTSDLLKLELIHVTDVEGQAMPRAICVLSDHFLAVGTGALVRVYSIGSRKLLRKTEIRCGQTTICKLQTRGDRIFACDAAASTTVLKFIAEPFSLAAVADDVVPRLSVATEVLDYDTVAGSDKLGNLFVLRVPADLDASDLGAMRTANLWEQTRSSGGAPNKLDVLTNYYLGELITSLRKASIVQGRGEALIYATTMGSVGCFIPFATKGDVEFFSLLEMHLRSLEDLSLVGRDHLAYRSCFAPVKGVVDGVLCEQFKVLPADKQDAIAKELDRTPAEIVKKLDDMRTLVLLA